MSSFFAPCFFKTPVFSGFSSHGFRQKRRRKAGPGPERKTEARLLALRLKLRCGPNSARRKQSHSNTTNLQHVILESCVLAGPHRPPKKKKKHLIKKEKKRKTLKAAGAVEAMPKWWIAPSKRKLHILTAYFCRLSP